MKLSKPELKKVLDRVIEDVAAMTKAETEADARLAKADPGEETVAEKTPEGSSSEPTPPAAPAADAAGEASASADGAPAPGPEASASPDAGGDPAADAGMTPEALTAEYAKLPPEELKMHLLACKSAAMAVLGDGSDGGEGSAPPGAPPVGPEASASAPPAPPAGAPPVGPPAGAPEMDPTMGKGEIKNSPGNGGKVQAGKMAKSEVEIDLTARLAKAEKAVVELEAQFTTQVGAMAEGIKRLIEKPIRKSVTGTSFVGKPGEGGEESPLAKAPKSEVLKVLTEVTRTKSLSKSDRDLVNQYCVGSVGVDKVIHLLS